MHIRCDVHLKDGTCLDLDAYSGAYDSQAYYSSTRPMHGRIGLDREFRMGSSARVWDLVERVRKIRDEIEYIAESMSSVVIETIDRYLVMMRNEGSVYSFNLMSSDHEDRAPMADVVLPRAGLTPGDMLDDGTLVISADGRGRGVLFNQKKGILKSKRTWVTIDLVFDDLGNEAIRLSFCVNGN